MSTTQKQGDRDRQTTSSPRSDYAPSGSPPKKKIFVGGLPWKITNEELQKEFEKYGKVKNAFVIKDKGTGESRGFGFVEFRFSSDAQRVLQTRNVVISGRLVECKESATRRMATSYGERRVSVPLQTGCDLQHLKSTFGKFGSVEHTNVTSGLLYVTFSTKAGMERCMTRGMVKSRGVPLAVVPAPVETKGSGAPARVQQVHGRSKQSVCVGQEASLTPAHESSSDTPVSCSSGSPPHQPEYLPKPPIRLDGPLLSASPSNPFKGGLFDIFLY